MLFYPTRTGHIEHMDAWGHGRAPRGDWTARPATLTIDDGDGHYAAWAYSGAKLDAAMTLAGLGRNFDDAVVWVIDGNRISPVRREEWVDGVETVDLDEDGEPIQFHYHPEKQPGGLCVG